MMEPVPVKRGTSTPRAGPPVFALIAARLRSFLTLPPPTPMDFCLSWLKRPPRKMVFPYRAMARTGPLTCQVSSGFSEGRAEAGTGSNSTPKPTESARDRRIQIVPPEGGGGAGPWSPPASGRAFDLLGREGRRSSLLGKAWRLRPAESIARHNGEGIRWL